MVGAAGVLGILTGVAGGVNAALWRGGVWGLVAGMGLPVWIAVAFMLGGGAARVVSRTDRMPGWLGIGTAWLYAAGSVVLLPRWVTPLPDFPLLFNVVVLPVFSWYGDDFAWRVLYGRKAREVDARRRNGYRDC